MSALLLLIRWIDWKRGTKDIIHYLHHQTRWIASSSPLFCSFKREKDILLDMTKIYKHYDKKNHTMQGWLYNLLSRSKTSICFDYWTRQLVFFLQF